MNQIKSIRVSAGLTQAQFAQMLNVHQTAVSQWEQEKTKPDLETVKRISELFHVSVDYILFGEEKENVPATADTLNDEHKKTLNELMELLDQVPEDKLELLLEMIKPLAES